MSLYENTDRWPTVPLSVLEAIEKAYPKRDFGPTVSLRQLDYHYGQRSVVTLLRQVYEEQNKNILNTNLRQ
jgi:hypothetical protein